MTTHLTSILVRLVCACLLLTCHCTCGFAQSYDAALGLRFGTEWGATAQVRLPVIHKNFVAEGIVHSSLMRDEGHFTLLGKQHQNILTRRLNLFYGAGAHVGWTSEIDPKTGDEFPAPFGIDGVVGVEATFARVNVSYDFKPAVNFRGESPIRVNSSLSVRYVLAGRNDIWDKKKEKETNKRRKKRKREKRREERRREREKEGKRWWQIWR